MTTKPTRTIFPSRMPGFFFLVGYFVLLIFSFILVISHEKAELHHLINQWHSGFSDLLMKYWTYGGDGLILLLIILSLLLISFRLFVSGITAFAISGGVTQLLKRLVFPDVPRPVKYFELHAPEETLYLVPGVDIHSWLSFPSGHTSTAFAVFFCLALVSRSWYTQLGFFILAAGVGFSRIYLSQHFVEDVVAGSILGLISGWLAWRWFRKNKTAWLNRSLFTIFAK